MANPLELLAGPVSSLVNTGLSYLGTKSLNKQQQAYNERNMALQYKYGQLAQRNSYANMLSGMLSGGLNPAFDGNSPVSGSMPSSSNPSSSFTAKEMDLLQGFQLSSLSEEVKNRRLINKHQELENELLGIDVENARAENDEYNTVNTASKDGNVINVETVKTKGQKGRLTAQQQLDEWNTIVGERATRRERAAADTFKSKLDAAVSKAQLNDPSFISAAKKMPSAELALLRKKIENQGLMNTYQEFVNNEYQSTTITNLIGLLKNNDMSFGDKVLAVLAFLFKNFVSKR